ncbi:hypothetical protein U8C32_12685 [Sinorhizobium medicae]|uniref:hypothetical protein n=1 Tax=Sinorhizobium medicae TaxID=110321 RepID=UPI000379D99C|nr:hypothetical protein [Sinorhizobium medicae]WQO44129.1 hypothetical protein U8C42_12835 [Sinorhizobium medicae]WQO66893.1 hypothetical protein U8C40_07055 [Sinorhizobium medicae]WQO71280.1 hypothetical protein U8C31_13320 [Sinorhizobium medicae]WQO90699.1 hypothetical protein U8C32_12685 [Sinorhizobium medicae]
MDRDESAANARKPRPSAWITMLIGCISAAIGLVLVGHFPEYGYWARTGLFAATVFVSIWLLSHAHAAIHRRRNRA